MSQSKIRVLCVDDHAFLVDGLKARFSAEDDLVFVGRLESAEGLAREADRLSADVVLLDIEMPGPDSFEALEDLVRLRPDTRAIMFSAFVRDHYIDEAVNAGAWGYISKGDEPEHVIDAIRKVARGEFAFSKEILARTQKKTKVKRNEPDAPPKSKLDSLTPRERQILRLIGRGMSRTEIAEALHRSPKTIDVHRASIMEKLKINDRVELVRFALREGLAEL
jgi:DNA-binding NarL/FixJ family response regulator